MPQVTRIDCPAALFSVTTKRGTVANITFTIVGRADLADDIWVATLRKGITTKTLTVVLTTATVDAPNDSVEVALTLSAVDSASLAHGTYRFDCMDDTTKEVWASGSITIERNMVVA